MACRFLTAVAGLAVLGLLFPASEASVYTVGNTAGWDISTDLASWPDGKMFYVGDTLLFQYSQYHTVNKVDKNGYDNCNASQAFHRSSGGNTSVPLTTAGENYFICGVLSHCLGGMKLKINVLRNVTAAAPSPAPEIPPGSPSTPTKRAENGSVEANSSSHCLRKFHLVMALGCSVGVYVWVLF